MGVPARPVGPIDALADAKVFTKVNENTLAHPCTPKPVLKCVALASEMHNVIPGRGGKRLSHVNLSVADKKIYLCLVDTRVPSSGVGLKPRRRKRTPSSRP